MHCAVMKDQWDCVLNDFEELGGKEFLVSIGRYNIEIFSCFLRLFAMLLFHFSSDQWWQYKKCFWDYPLFSRIQSLHRLLEVDDDDEEEYSVVLILVSDGRIIFWLKIIPLSFPDGFSSCRWAARHCLAFDRLDEVHSFSTQNLRTASQRFPARCCRSPCCCSIPWLTYSKPWEISDPRVRIVFVHRFNSNFHSMFTLQITGCDFQYGSNLSVLPNPTFWFRWVFISLLCTHDKPLNLWIVRILQCLLTWSAVRPQLLSGILHQYKISSHDLAVITFQLVLDIFAIDLLALDHRSKVCVCVFITLGTKNGLDCSSTTSLPVLPWQESHSSHISATAP